jgi:hypothetical protein
MFQILSIVYKNIVFLLSLRILGLTDEIPERATGHVVELVRVDLAAALASGVVVRLVVGPPAKQLTPNLISEI